MAKKEEIYKKTTEFYGKDYRAYNNLAALEMIKGDEAAAKRYLSQALNADENAPEVYANQGLLSLKDGNLQRAENEMAKATGANNFGQALGALNIAKGNYAEAEENLKGINSNTAALAQLLNKNYAAAASTLDAIKNPNGLTDYLHAIVAARRGNKFAAESYLAEAVKKDPSLQAYADNDLELAIVKK